jgi:hypothetical protein
VGCAMRRVGREESTHTKKRLLRKTENCFKILKYEGSTQHSGCAWLRVVGGVEGVVAFCAWCCRPARSRHERCVRGGHVTYCKQIIGIDCGTARWIMAEAAAAASSSSGSSNQRCGRDGCSRQQSRLLPLLQGLEKIRLWPTRVRLDNNVSFPTPATQVNVAQRWRPRALALPSRRRSWRRSR